MTSAGRAIKVVSIGQILIKIGRLWEPADGWMGADSVAIPYLEFRSILRSPEYPSYSADKTIREKWSALRCYCGLVDQACPAGNPVVIYLNRDAAKRIIQDSIPRRIRSNYASREHYLKTGEVL